MSAAEQGAGSTERKPLSLHELATLHRRAAAVANELALIEDVLRGTTPEWMEQAAKEDQQSAVRDMQFRDDAGFALEFSLRSQPMPGGAR